jgi:hypothetical protein
MKFWRRHKHELDRNEGDEPLPAAPEKKMRYSREDDILLARYFHNRPEGTSDKIFQAFGRIVSTFFRSIVRAYKCLDSTLIILGRVGRNITEFTRPKSIISSSNS